MITREPTPIEHKLVILLALDQLGPTTALQLLRYMVENELMDYITLQLAIAELDDTALVRKVPHTLGTLYAPSAQGYETLRAFQGRIAPSRIEHIRSTAAAWGQRFRTEKQILSDWRQAPTGEYIVRLQLMEQELMLLDLSVTVATREQAGTFCARWPEAAPELYAQMMRALGGADDLP